MPKKRISISTKGLLVLAGLAISLSASACINETGTDRNGQTVNLDFWSHDEIHSALLNKETEEDKIQRAKRYIENAKADPNINTLNDLAVTLIRFGRYESAIKHLTFIEKKSPGRYQTATNLGTAYELLGDNKQALHWIRQGIARNKNAHASTEWLHAKILEAKLGNQILGKDSLLKLEFGNTAMPIRPKSLPSGNNGNPVSIQGLGKALKYQLIERTEFVSAPDAIVASLLFDWANLEMVAGTMESADFLYDLALTYGYPDKQLIVLRKNEIKRIMSLPKKQSKGEIYCELCLPTKHEP